MKTERWVYKSVCERETGEERPTRALLSLASLFVVVWLGQICIMLIIFVIWLTIDEYTHEKDLRKQENFVCLYFPVIGIVS